MRVPRPAVRRPAARSVGVGGLGLLAGVLSGVLAGLLRAPRQPPR